MTVKPLSLLRDAVAARRDAQPSPAARARPTGSNVRQQFGVDELSRGRGAALRSPIAAAKLGQLPPAVGRQVDALKPAAARPAFAAEGPTLKVNSEGPEVLQLQEMLTALGYDPGPLDGKFGKRTANAVKQYQRDRGLAADGVVGEKTRSALASETPEPPAATEGPTNTNGTTGPNGATGTDETSATAYGTWTDDALLAVDPKTLPPAEQRAYYDEVYQRAADLYFPRVRNSPHNLSGITDADFNRLSAFAEKLGLAVNRKGRLWGTERERPFFTAIELPLPPRGYDLAIDQWCLTLPENDRYSSGRESYNDRYKPYTDLTTGRTKTRCDLFARDVIHAMLGIVIGPRSAPAIYKWLNESEARKEGWKPVDAARAQELANAGYMVVATIPSHVQVIRPEDPNRGDGIDSPVAAQTGKSAYSYDSASKGMGESADVMYFCYRPPEP